MEEKDEIISAKGVCKTALATPGLYKVHNITGTEQGSTGIKRQVHNRYRTCTKQRSAVTKYCGYSKVHQRYIADALQMYRKVHLLSLLISVGSVFQVYFRCISGVFQVYFRFISSHPFFPCSLVRGGMAGLRASGVFQ